MLPDGAVHEAGKALAVKFLFLAVRAVGRGLLIEPLAHKPLAPVGVSAADSLTSYCAFGLPGRLALYN